MNRLRSALAACFLAVMPAHSQGVPPRNNVPLLIQKWNKVYYRCLGERTDACYKERDRLSDQLTALGYCSEREFVRHPHLPEPSRDWVWRPCSESAGR